MRHNSAAVKFWRIVYFGRHGRFYGDLPRESSTVIVDTSVRISMVLFFRELLDVLVNRL